MADDVDHLLFAVECLDDFLHLLLDGLELALDLLGLDPPAFVRFDKLVDLTFNLLKRLLALVHSVKDLHEAVLRSLNVREESLSLLESLGLVINLGQFPNGPLFVGCRVQHNPLVVPWFIIIHDGEPFLFLFAFFE